MTGYKVKTVSGKEYVIEAETMAEAEELFNERISDEEYDGWNDYEVDQISEEEARLIALNDKETTFL